ncbi:hypothetical protein [Salibacterium aidingense]|uniref:hypothetical protein n=1 Tax=Salibacterium aidingense TaxID=384933 RepID=UPI00047A6623|nr:hypothetical protein [Salibacterium aidingense]
MKGGIIIIQLEYYKNKIVIQNESNVTFYIGTFRGPVGKLFHGIPRVIINTTYVKVEDLEKTSFPRYLMQKPGKKLWPTYQELLDMKVIPPGETIWERDQECLKKAWKQLPRQLGKLNLSVYSTRIS